jgi:hypothetical protein
MPQPSWRQLWSLSSRVSPIQLSQQQPGPTNHSIYVQLPNKTKIQAIHTCQLNIPGPPNNRNTSAHLFAARPCLTLHRLTLRSGLHCFDQQTVKIHHANQVIMTGYRDTSTNLWVIPMSNQAPTDQLGPANNEHRANSAYRTSTLPELVQFLHAACGNPVPFTWIRAIEQGHFATALARPNSQSRPKTCT